MILFRNSKFSGTTEIFLRTVAGKVKGNAKRKDNELKSSEFNNEVLLNYVNNDVGKSTFVKKNQKIINYYVTGLKPIIDDVNKLEVKCHH